MAFIPKYEYDVFVSHAHADGREWVEAFCVELEAELKRRLPGRNNPSIFLDKNDLRAGDRIDSILARGIDSAALFLAIVSPKYQASRYCIREEIGRFQSLYGAASDRIFQVIRLPIDGDPPVPEVLAVSCGEKSNISLGVEGAVNGLVPRLNQLRREMAQLYIAWTGRAQEEDRDRIALEFEQQKYVIRPNNVFTEFSRDDAIRRELKDSSLSIHLFGLDEDPLAERQFQMAIELGQPVVIVTRNPEETRRDPLDPSPAIYLRDPNATSHLIERVKKKLDSRSAPSAGAARQVFLLFKPDLDWRCADDLVQMLRDRGAEVLPPKDPDLDPFLNLDAHVEELRQSSGVILCWGDAPIEWLNGVDRKFCALRTRDPRLGTLTRAKYVVGPTDRVASTARNEFLIRNEHDLDPFLAALPGESR